jgi:ESCRT-II complex subunit VPS25
MGAPNSAFSFPQHYHFPPFFTKQPNFETNSMRVQMWKELILDYCRHNRIFILNVREAVASSSLFGNEAISRRLQPSDANEILHLMATAGLAEWYATGVCFCRVVYMQVEGKNEKIEIDKLKCKCIYMYG